MRLASKFLNTAKSSEKSITAPSARRVATDSKIGPWPWEMVWMLRVPCFPPAEIATCAVDRHWLALLFPKEKTGLLCLSTWRMPS